ncbi:MAG: FliH/SctL family protein, partial [Deferrisomatales bacterium]
PRLVELAAELAAHKPALYEEARTQVVELVLAVAGRVLGPLAESDQQAVVRVVERALRLLSDRENLTLRVNPADLRSLVEAKPTLLEAIDGIQKLTVVEDPSVKRGGCLVQTPSAEIDARLETQLGELARAVRGAG